MVHESLLALKATCVFPEHSLTCVFLKSPHRQSDVDTSLYFLPVSLATSLATDADEGFLRVAGMSLIVIDYCLLFF